MRSYNRIIGDAHEMVEILKTPTTLVDRSDKKLKIKRGGIVMDNVTFTHDEGSYFEVLSSPSLYPTQKIHVVIRSDQCANPQLRFFVEYLSCDGAVENNFSPQYPILHGRNEFDWVVPKLNSQAIFRFGVEEYK